MNNSLAPKAIAEFVQWHDDTCQIGKDLLIV
jgi:hypothetical protein